MVRLLAIILLLIPSLSWGGSARRFSMGPKVRHVVQTFTYTGGTPTFTIPSDAFTTPALISHGVNATIVGAGGAGSVYYASSNQPGQAGDIINVSFLTAGRVLTIWVGQGGRGTNNFGCVQGGTAWGWVPGTGATNCIAGGGGGSSAVVSGSSFPAPGGNGGGSDAGGSGAGLGGNYPALAHDGAPGGAALAQGQGTIGPNGTDGWVTIDYWQ